MGQILPCVSSKITHEGNSDITFFSTSYISMVSPQKSHRSIAAGLLFVHLPFLLAFSSNLLEEKISSEAAFTECWNSICGGAFPMTGVPPSQGNEIISNNQSGTKIKIKWFQQEYNWVLMTLNVRSIKSLSWCSPCSSGLEKQHTTRLQAKLCLSHAAHYKPYLSHNPIAIKSLSSPACCSRPPR